MYEFGYHYIKPKLCYMDTDSFTIHMKTKDFYKDIANEVEKWFDTSNYECDKLLPKRESKKEIEKIKDELGGKILTKFADPRQKTFLFNG